MKKCLVLIGVSFALLSATANGQQTGSQHEQNLRRMLKPAKVQLLSATSAIMVDGEMKANTSFAGVATIHPLGKGLFVRPFLTTGIVNPEKHGADNFHNAQLGITLGHKVTKRFSVVGGASVTALFLENGTQYRETLNFATATVVKKFDSGALQLLTPVAINQSPNGDWNTVVGVGVGWVF